MSRIFDQIKEERQRQDEKWGEQNRHPLKWFAIIGEEFGEMCEAYLEYDADGGSGKGDPRHFEDMQREAIQVAASCVAMLESFDRKGCGS